jgi:trehalose synthase
MGGGGWDGADPLVQRVDVTRDRTLDDYAALARLAEPVAELRSESAELVARLAGRTVWLVNSAARGGGVAEMLPPVVRILRDLGVRTEWVVIGSREPGFFELTKHLHNLLHGVGEPRLGPAERALFERVSRANAEALTPFLRPGDLLAVHDPQPLALAGLLRRATPIIAVWRCHIGVDLENAATRGAWTFLEPYLAAYDRAVFSAPEYIPSMLARRASVIRPAIDPLAPKNRDLSLRETIEVMCNGGLIPCPGPTVEGPYAVGARRLRADGAFAPADATDNFGLLTRPIVTQISRWDRLKGFMPLMRAFARLKLSLDGGAAGLHAPSRRLALARLVLAGPDADAVQDDPEAVAVLDELRAAWLSLPPQARDDIAIVTVPLEVPERNSLVINALQRASTVVVQNSLREGFGLTITEAMWKGVPVLSNSRACGPRHQIRDGLDGRLIRDPEDEDELRRALEEMLVDPARLDAWGRSAQRRVYDSFLVLRQLREWGQLFKTIASG